MFLERKTKRKGKEMSQRLKRDRLAHENRLIKNSTHQDYAWKQITNKYKNTCCVCNRSITVGDIILWHKDKRLVMHLPEVCQFLGTRKKMPKRRKIQDSGEFPVAITYKSMVQLDSGYGKGDGNVI